MKWSVIIFFFLITKKDCAKILAYFPTPSISHQVVFRPITKALADRGHKVIVITTDPVGTTSPNLTEIDVHDVSYKHWKGLNVKHIANKNKISTQIGRFLEKLATVVKIQMDSPAVKEILRDKGKKYFDILLIEGPSRPLLGLSHLFDAPIVLTYSLGIAEHVLNDHGSPLQPLLYPTMFRQRQYNLTFIEKCMEIFNNLFLQYTVFNNYEIERSETVKNFGHDVPSITELKKNIKMVFVNENPIWASNRPLPPNMLFIGGIHEGAHKELPKDLTKYLDSAKYGVIYVSFGTNVIPSLLPKEKIEIMSTVFSQLPYNVLWKWNKDSLPGQSNNTKISKWFPQSILLQHPNIKLFITQGGLQSTDESILTDQWYNSEKYVQYGIGLQLDITTLTHDDFKQAITTVINDKRFKERILKLRSLTRESTNKPLDNAVWWIEHVIKHGGSHLRNPAADLSWAEYYEIRLIVVVLAALVAGFVMFAFILKCFVRFVFQMFAIDKVIKTM